MVGPITMTARGWYERGYELKRAGDFNGALEAFRHSIKLGPHAAAPWVGLAQLLEANNQLEDSRACLTQATLAEPKYLIARQQLALAHQRLGYIEEAKIEYQRALALDPNSAATHFSVGQLFEDIGEAQEAADAYRKAIVLAPLKQEALANLLGLGGHVDIAAELNKAEGLMSTLPLPERSLLGYGVGKAQEQQKNYTAAFNSYAIANQARRQASGRFDRAAFDTRIENMVSVFSAGFFKERKGWGNASELPAFIVGLPRSGTTLTEQIISSHPDCFGAGELNTLTDLATGTPDRLGKADPSWPTCAPELSRLQLEALGQDYLEQARVRAPAEAIRIVDKQPLNFWHLGLVALALPSARIIHCTRDIRDCGFSIFAHNFNTQQNWSTDLEDIAYYWRGYQRLMHHWASVTELQFLDVCYEDTVLEVEASAQSLLDFLGLPWDDRVLAFHENKRAVQTPSRWQVRQPVFKSSIARWQHYGDKLDALRIAAKHARSGVRRT
jgi:tetratricopeptide (TPR) repeat protein